MPKTSLVRLHCIGAVDKIKV